MPEQLLNARVNELPPSAGPQPQFLLAMFNTLNNTLERIPVSYFTSNKTTNNFEYASDTEYLEDAVVTYGGRWWQAQQDMTDTDNIVPGSNPLFWIEISVSPSGFVLYQPGTYVDDNVFVIGQYLGVTYIFQLLDTARPYSSTNLVTEFIAGKWGILGSIEHFRGYYTSEAALDAVTGGPGDYAYIDTGVGSDSLKYIWDENDAIWVQAGSGGAATWGGIGGSLSDQADLWLQLQAKELFSNKATDFSVVNHTLYPSVQAVKVYVDAGLSGKQDTIGYTPENVSNKKTTLVGADNTGYPTTLTVSTALSSLETSVKAYADGLVVGLLDFRGTFSAAGGTYPNTGGSGAAGAILKGDFYIFSVGGTVPTGVVIEAGDAAIALIDAPGNTQANWGVIQNNIGYTPENSANKATNFAVKNNTLYPTTQAVETFVVGVQDIPVPAGAMMSRTVNGAQPAQEVIGANNNNYYGLYFPAGSTTYAQFGVSLPRNYNNGNITAVFKWYSKGGTATQVVEWNIAAVAFGDNVSLDAARPAVVSIQDALINTNRLHISAATAGFSPSSPADSKYVLFEISRTGTGADTMASTAILLEVVLYVTTDAPTAV